MPDKLHIDEERGLIVIESFGIVTKADIAASIDVIRNAVESTNIQRVFVDTTGQEQMPSTTEIYELFSQFPRRTRTALLVKATQPTAGDIEFVEHVSVNRGTRMKVFDDQAEAMRWLEAE